MWLPSKDRLAGAAFDPNSLLVVQAWHELLTATTPDTFRSRVLDIFLLLEELDRIIELALLDDRWTSHVHAVCEEIEEEKEDFIRLLKDAPVAISAIDAVARFRDGKAGLPVLAERLKIIASIARDPIGLLVEDAVALAEEGKNKKQLLRRLGTLATHIQRQGLGQESLASISEGLLDSTPAEIVSFFCSPLKREPRRYFCFLAVAPSKGASAIFSGSEFKQVGKKRFSSKQSAQNWYQSRSSDFLVQVEVSAKSSRSAAEIALLKINTLLNLVVLYANNAAFRVSTAVLVESNHDVSEVEVTPSKHFGLLPRQDSSRIARTRFSNLDKRLEGRVSNILESHALGIAAEDPRSAIINLWTALEAIAGGYGDGNIGERVARVVSPVVASRRVEKIVSYLAIQMRSVLKDSDRAIDLSELPASTTSNIDRVDLLACLSGPANNPGIMSVFENCSQSPLLCHRMYSAWEELSCPQRLRSALKLSAKRIRWQVLRLYRARNLLVHKGERDELVWRLLENAQYYVSASLGRILQHLEDNPEWTVDTSLEYQRQRFEDICERLGHKNAGGVSIADLVIRPAQAGKALWGPNSRFPGPYNAKPAASQVLGTGEAQVVVPDRPETDGPPK